MRLRTILVAAVLAVLGVLAVPGVAVAHGSMISVDLDCEGDAVTVHTNPRFLWVPGHVESGDSVTHIVTSIFGEVKGNTNAALSPRLVECTVVGGPLDGLVVWGYFVP